MDSSRSGNRGGACGDPEALQRLVDGELDDAAEELWLHHAATCASCGDRVAELGALRDWCAERLGSADDGAEWRRDAAVARVKARIDATVRRPASRPAWRWWRASLAAGLVGLALVLSPAPSPVGASAERVERETVLRERAWMDQPGKVLRWTIEGETTNNPRQPDGYHRNVSWRHNLEGGRTAELLKKFDKDGRLVWVRCDGEDGSEIVYNGRTATVSVVPSPAQLRAEAADFDPPLTAALESWLRRTAIWPETRAYVQTFSGGERTSRATIDLLHLDAVGLVYRVRWSGGTPGSWTDPPFSMENDITRRGFRRVRMESIRRFPDGSVQHETARWSDYRVVPLSEFEAELAAFQALAASVPTHVRRTAREIATGEQARLAERAARAGQGEKRHGK